MKPVTYILVADASHARVLVNTSPGRGVFQLADSDFRRESEADFNTDMKTPASIDDLDDAGGQLVERVSLPDRAKALFARWLSAFLDHKFTSRQFSRLIIVAPPEMLDYLHHAINGPLVAAVAGEIARDLTPLSNGDVYYQLQKSLAIPI